MIRDRGNQGGAAQSTPSLAFFSNQAHLFSVSIRSRLEFWIRRSGIQKCLDKELAVSLGKLPLGMGLDGLTDGLI
jgi:hypothetical protein